jgi:hypothetical protein
MIKSLLTLKVVVGHFILLVATTCLLEAQVLIDKRITVQPIYLSNGSTTANPSQTLFEAVTDKIWSQAGIDVQFLSPLTYVNTTYYSNVTDSDGDNTNGLLSLAQKSGQSWSLGTLDTNVVRLFFVPTINNNSNVYGYSLQTVVSSSFVNPLIVTPTGGAYAIAISDSAIAANRMDVIAHELGHALGLGHDTLGAGGASNLMSSPRTSPTSITQVFPDGSVDMLTGAITAGNPDFMSEQIDRARVIPIAVTLPVGQQYIYTAVPEPSVAAAVLGVSALGIAGLVRIRRRRPVQ